MPPKVKTDRAEIINAAFDVAMREGITAITAQSVSAVLGVSVTPIFRVFRSVEELRLATISHIHTFHLEYLKNYPFTRSRFLTYGLAYISFARDYPQLFDALTVSGLYIPKQSDKPLSEQLSFIVDSAADAGTLNQTQAQEVFYHIWIYTHGLACLACRGKIDRPEAEIKELLITAFETFRKHYDIKKES